MDGLTNDNALDLTILEKKQNFSQMLMSQGQCESMVNDMMKERSTTLPNSSRIDAQGLPLSIEGISMEDMMSRMHQAIDP